MVLEPQMHARLVSHLDLVAQGRIERRGRALDHRALGFIGQVGSVEIGEVVVLDPEVQGTAGQMVQHRLIDRPGDDQPVGQVEAAPQLQHGHQVRGGAQDRVETRGQSAVQSACFWH
jgi:hypothetical protein